MERGDPPLSPEAPDYTPEALVGACLDIIRWLDGVDGHLGLCVEIAITDHIPGMSLVLTEALAASLDVRDRYQATTGLSEVIAHDRERGLALADAMLQDETHVAEQAADYLQFAAEGGQIAQEDIAMLRARHPDAWWPPQH